MTQRFTDFICYANTTVSGCNNEVLIEYDGIRQALNFGLRRGYERYNHIVIDGSIQADLTHGHILNAMGSKCPVSIIAELTDPKQSDQHSDRRRLAHARLGQEPLVKFHDECIVAMVDIGQNAAGPLRRFLLKHPQENILVVCRDIYLAQIILTTFFSDLCKTDQQMLISCQPPDPCSGYRLTWDGHQDLLGITGVH